MNDALQALRGCKYLYLVSLVETEVGGLRAVVQEAVLGSSAKEAMVFAEPLASLRQVLQESTPIVHGENVFSITWPSYIAYSVENESFAAPEPVGSVGTGRLLVEYSKSVYLEYLSKASFASAEYPGPFKHWAVLCLDHIVNVASVDEPHVEVQNGT